jgi:hypothetical protein
MEVKHLQPSLYLKAELDADQHLKLEEDDYVIGRYIDNKKNYYKTIGNRKTDILVITSKKIIICRLVKAYVWPVSSSKSVYTVITVPYHQLKTIRLVEKSWGRNEIHFEISDVNLEDNSVYEWTEIYALYLKSAEVQELIIDAKINS